ncbi:VanZ family protein [Halobium salinum]|uniref:VanZ family protein n=1 Tax=Halobium salinum TaxID=1364940 RepID=A0ABD5PA26_9EURY|nr:VanZ family protein [Halobium salinum]
MRLPSPGRRLRWTAVLVVAVAILAASVAPPGPDTGEPFVLLGVAGDKWLHAAAYAGLAATAGWAVFLDRPVPRALVLAVCLSAGYGVAMEVVQAPLPARQFDVADMLANAVGAVVAAVGMWVLVGTVEESDSADRD